MADLEGGGGGDSGDDPRRPRNFQGVRESGATLFQVLSDRQLEALASLLAASGVLLAFADDPVGFVVGALFEGVPDATAALLKDPLGTILGALTFGVINFIVIPVVNGILWVAFTILDIIILMVFGTDRIVGPVKGTFPGFADLLFLVVGVAGQPFGVGADAVVSFFASTQAAITAGLTPLGPLAPIVAAGAGTFMLAGSVYVLGKGIEAVDIPLINKGPLVDILTLPGRLLLRLFGFGGD